MTNNKPIYHDKGESLEVTFTKCACKMLFNKKSLIKRQPNTCMTYCKSYPNCDRSFLDAYAGATEALEGQGFEAVLVVNDEEIDSEMDYTGMGI